MDVQPGDEWETKLSHIQRAELIPNEIDELRPS
jgi:hypothetical protein